ncbi:hypothetical protein NF867_10840 [Solitalea sp. MAHUQ-68]|uniref:Outer membrane protein beta-barrel domain-containing protein n=1 Tax=Solitalea agri TaxID=2953739 RepID=A0A9X2F342_9SPHI|nr:hypothetical protein [Solitalea agri]MCO4293361.1 hypothetical protein [Solitalea agri]
MKEKNKLDGLFKDAFDKAGEPIAFSEQEWGLLEKRLDKKDRKRTPIFWISLVGGIAACLALVFIWFQAPQSAKQGEQNLSSKPLTKPTEQAIVKSKTDKSANTVSEVKPIVSNKPLLPFSEKESKNDLSTNYLTYTQEGGQQAKNDGYMPQKVNPISSISKDLTSDTNKAVLTEPLRTQGVEGVGIAKASGLKKEKSNRQFGKFTFTVSAAPSFNGVNTLKDASLGGDFGGFLTMSLTKKLSVSTGAIYAKKVYSTGYENYNPVNPLPFSYTPTSIDADCRVLDIPLNINYRVFEKRRDAISITTGLSSYIMLNEDYHFNYNYSSPSDPQNYSVNNQNKHWFNVVNLQLQYERKLSPGTSLGIQPFMKIPINGVGYSRVDLKSIGVAINFNINLNTNGKSKAKSGN